MRYPIAIECGSELTAFGVVVPDLKGCFSAGDTREEALENVREAVTAWIEATLEAGGEVPLATSIQHVRSLPEFRGWEFASIDVDFDRSALPAAAPSSPAAAPL